VRQQQPSPGDRDRSADARRQRATPEYHLWTFGLLRTNRRSGGLGHADLDRRAGASGNRADHGGRPDREQRRLHRARAARADNRGDRHAGACAGYPRRPFRAVPAACRGRGSRYQQPAEHRWQRLDQSRRRCLGQRAATGRLRADLQFWHGRFGIIGWQRGLCACGDWLGRLGWRGCRLCRPASSATRCQRGPVERGVQRLARRGSRW
jgi:hypothetical protein